MPRGDTRSRSATGLYPQDVTPGAFARQALDSAARLSVAGQFQLDGVAIVVGAIEGVSLPADMGRAEIGIAEVSGVPAVGRLWRSDGNAYEYQLREITERDVSEDEIKP